jgi:hypothetical protein
MCAEKEAQVVDNHNPLSLPVRQPARTKALSIRLTPNERAAVDALAARLGVQPSHLARHFLLQAIAFYSARTVDNHGADNVERKAF